MEMDRGLVFYTIGYAYVIENGFEMVFERLLTSIISRTTGNIYEKSSKYVKIH